MPILSPIFPYLLVSFKWNSIFFFIHFLIVPLLSRNFDNSSVHLKIIMNCKLRPCNWGYMKIFRPSWSVISFEKFAPLQFGDNDKRPFDPWIKNLFFLEVDTVLRSEWNILSDYLNLRSVILLTWCYTIRRW